MSFHFTGASRTRAPVTLGGTSTLTADPAASARVQRIEREQQRNKQIASVKIQSQARRILQSRQIRSQWRTQSLQLLDRLEAHLSAISLHDLVLATRALLISLGPETRSLDQDDVQLFLRWVRLVSQSIDGAQLVFLPFRQPQHDAIGSWLRLLRLTCKHSLRFLARAANLRAADSLVAHHSSLDLEILAFLGLLTGVDANSSANFISVGTENNTFASSLLALLLDLGLHRALRAHILSFTIQQKATASSLSPALSLSLAPLHSSKATTSPASRATKAQGASINHAIEVDEDSHESISSATRRRAVHSFAVEIMTIPALRKRLPLNAVTELAKDLPFIELLDWITTFRPDHVRVPQVDRPSLTSSIAKKAAQALSQPYLLSNLLAFGSQRAAFFKDGASLADYLQALTNAQDWLPSSAFDPTSPSTAASENGAAAVKVSSRAIGVKSAGSEAAETYERLRILISDNHLTTILSMSNKYPTSTRGPLFAFICSTLSAWPVDMQDRVLNRLLYSGADSLTVSSAKRTRPVGPSGTGLIREFWRGYVRGSTLARTLASAHDNTRAREILSTLSDLATRQDWPALVLVLEMLSKVLLTMGDDEFLSSVDESFGINGGAARSNSGWLSRDEIMSISGLLRNVAFAMYWFEGKAPLVHLNGDDVEDPKAQQCTPRVPGMRMTLLSLRGLVTKLLKQLHSRDSRHRFAPADHWLMVSHLDLQDFMRTVVLEEEQLSSEQQDEQEHFGTSARSPASQPAASSARAMDVDGNSTDSEGDSEDDEPHSSQPLARLQQLRAQGGPRSRHLTALNLAFLSPRLGILNNVPFMIPFDVRVQIFRQFVHIDAVKNGIYRDRWQRRQAVKIRRGHVAPDGFASLAALGPELKKPLEIVFVDKFGQPEPGIDGGGLFKEFLTSLVREAFDTNRGLWKATDAQELYPNPHTYAQSGEQLDWYEFLGRVIGKALYEGILVDAKFAGFFLSKMLGKQSFLDDLGSIDSLDKELYKGLISLKNYQGNVEDLSLNFTVTDEEFGVSMTRELVPDGANVPVTNLNRMEYIYRISHYRLSTQIQHQCNSFFNGLADMINPRWLRNFNREELSVLISGTDDPVDIADLRKHTVLGGYHEQDLTVQHFWRALESFDQPMRKAFLKFVTSSPNPPLLGFSQLNPMFAIRKAGEDKTRLPTASTCVNMLKLPDYEDEQTCRDKLKYAIMSEAGFDLS
ncbi:related to ubiquitin protein ligase e3 [Melanopsichium pennsylvanicum]|uniref:HECT-type E3 ubiquitin transferase n=2 Tax=Melanopsichium pennsylvanicum TaxID=63383 RepID=A0AAJ4XFX9_9BASI|nr:related to ubiquitin protein ligase e3 [Melanopsichium pennsylvanicum 4]SNX81740.1 related to ubiquitin protein ligase e3 [Melanopsichium pennsylvanicum]